jgi:succinoglycan biosynthesis protein ExoA
VRLQAAGYAIWLEGDLIVEYIPRAAIGSLCKQYYNYGKGRAKTRLLHRRPLKVRQILPLFVAPAIALAAFAPVSPWAAAPAAIWITMVLVAGALLAARTGDVCDAFSGVAAAIMHCAWSVGFIRQYFDPVKKRDADRPAIFEAVKSVETRHV